MGETIANRGGNFLISISLCMIVKDEEDTLPRCLASVQGLVEEIIVADTPVTLFLGEDEQRPLGERVARFLPKVCGNYTIIDTKDYELKGISEEFRGSISHLVMHAVNNRVDAHMEAELCHPLEIRRYYRQLDY